MGILLSGSAWSQSRPADVPTAVNDSAVYPSFTTITIDVLQNDLNPSGLPLEIWEVTGTGFSITADQKVQYKDTVRNLQGITMTGQYRVKSPTDTSYYSGWATIYVTYTKDPSVICALPDAFQALPEMPVTVNLLKNDYLPSSSDSVYISIVGGARLGLITHKDDSTITFLAKQDAAGKDTLFYYIRHKSSPVPMSFNYIYVDVTNNSFANLDINNVDARINGWGSQFFDGATGGPHYFVPKGTPKTPMFTASMWMGGTDDAGEIHFAGYRYGQGPGNGPAATKTDFWIGPVSDSTAYNASYDSLWHKVWKLNRTDIDYHRAHWSDQGYQPIPNIATWPAHGDPALGQSLNLAPFFDYNGDGNYNPLDGDYPIIFGDQSVFFIYNDDRSYHSETTGPKLRTEIHAWAYAFDLPGDSAFKNTIFFHYEFFNRSDQTYHNTWLACFADIDLGYANDDFIGSDVERSMFFGYNGTPVDGSGQPYAYGASPPSISVTMLGGPLMDPDLIANPRYDELGHQLCDFSVNGTGFGDTVVDNERYGLQRFMYFNNSNAGVPPYMLDPDYYTDYYKLMQGYWRDSTRLIYGGNGHASAGGYGPECSFMFPGESDTLDWGVGCQPPNGLKNWTEETAGNNPSDRRGMGSAGPFTFKPGDVQQLDLAYVWARAYGANDPLASVDKLRQMNDIVRVLIYLGNTPEWCRLLQQRPRRDRVCFHTDQSMAEPGEGSASCGIHHRIIQRNHC